MNLDELLQQADEAGIPGVNSIQALVYCGIKDLKSGLYIKYLQKGEYKIVNPLEDDELLLLWETMYRYMENGWEGKSPYVTEEIPLIMYTGVYDKNLKGERFYLNSDSGEISARVKIYDEQERFFVEGQYNQMLGIYSDSQHKEEALELLSLMHSDEEIVQLLRYGIEGVHYRKGDKGLEDVVTSELEVFEYGYSIGEKTWRAPDGFSLGNCLMYVELEEELGIENKEEEWYAEFSDIELIPYLENFSEEQKAIANQIKDITFIISKNGGWVTIENNASSLITLDENYKSQIEELRFAFAEAGYNELAKEVNEAYGLE